MTARKLVKKVTKALHDFTYLSPRFESVPFDVDFKIIGGCSVVGHDGNDLTAIDSLPHCKSVVTNGKSLAGLPRAKMRQETGQVKAPPGDSLNLRLLTLGI